MANVTKRTNKVGTASYLIRAYVGEASDGRQLTKSMTWHPPAGMRPGAADKQAEREAILFEERVKSGVVSIDGKTKFSDYAARWMETAELAPKTREQYDYLLRRINKAIGHIPLEKLRVGQLQAFYKNLREAGVKETGSYAVSSVLDKKRTERKLTIAKLAELSCVCRETVSIACKGCRVSVETARKISIGLGEDMGVLFTVTKGSDTLSARSVWHYHKLIRAILSSAKKARIIPHNIASEHMDAPKLPRNEARYLTDDEARRFLAALQNEPDIRVKTVLTLDLFSGLRRGELCGLSWSDIDFNGNVVHVRRASQYIAGQGIVVVPTKNRSSDRTIAVPPHVTSLLSEYRRWWLEYKLSMGDLWQGEEERLFIQSDGKPLFPGTVNHWMRGFIEGTIFPTPHRIPCVIPSPVSNWRPGWISALYRHGQDTPRHRPC